MDGERALSCSCNKAVFILHSASARVCCAGLARIVNGRGSADIGATPGQRRSSVVEGTVGHTWAKAGRAAGFAVSTGQRYVGVEKLLA